MNVSFNSCSIFPFILAFVPFLLILQVCRSVSIFLFTLALSSFCFAEPVFNDGHRVVCFNCQQKPGAAITYVSH